MEPALTPFPRIGAPWGPAMTLLQRILWVSTRRNSDRGCSVAALCSPENTDAGKLGEMWEGRACLLRDFSGPLGGS